MQRLLIVFIVLVISACSTYKHPYIKSPNENLTNEPLPTGIEKSHTLFLVGDAGDVDNPESGDNYVLSHIQKMVDQGDEENQSVVFLGDNLYPKGLHRKKHKDRALEEKILNAQLDVVKNNATKAYFIPGNHDWNKMGKNGRKHVKRQEDYVESYYNEKKKIHHYPNNACGDPKAVKIDKNLVFIFIDSQWWLQNWSKEKHINHHCHVDSRREFVDEIEDLFIKYKNKQIVVMMHHPFFSNGNHGGNYSFKQHVFPFTGLSKNLYIPLPVLGSIYPLYRQLGGSPQDISSDEHSLLLEELRTASSVAKNVIFASGHEHLLQYNYNQGEHFIVSGAGCKVDYSKGGGDAEFVYSKRGYAQLHFYKDGEIWMDLITVNPDMTSEIEFRKRIVEPRAGTIESENTFASSEELESYKLIAANPDFAHSGFVNAIVGTQYRDIWTTPVNAPIIDLTKAKNGLTPIKKGGGQASNSLRMETETGKHYILRSINKDYRKLVPESWRGLQAINIMKDQNSASHPYGALIIPALSEAAGIYYTEPKLVYLAHQEQLGNYNELFPEELYLMEERPSGNWSDHAPFGNSEKIIGYNDLLLNLRTKKRQFIDQKWVLKSRLFDMWIHDWDRHDDQWRWASFEHGDSTIYRPIPRDRDQAFYKFVGLVPRIVAGLVEKKFKTFGKKIKDVKALGFNAKHFDRFFLNELSWAEWEEVVMELQNSISEQDIQDAMNLLPDEVRGVQEKEIVEKLIHRKKDLKKYARELYEFINAGVDVVGTDHKDIFEVERLPNGFTNVKVYEPKKGDDVLKFDRTFEPDVVKDIRLYGLSGKDDFIIRGDSKNAIKLRIIGGLGDDELKNKSENRKTNRVIVYDERGGIKIDHKKSIVDKRSDELEANEYDRNQFKYNTSFPFPILGYTGDDGFWFGFSNSIVKHGYRRDPYASKHSYSISIAPNSRNAVRAFYRGDFNKVLFDKLSYTPLLAFENPSYINYFGLGNDTVLPDRPNEYNWVRLSSYRFESLFSYDWNHQTNSLSFGPHAASIDMKPQEGRILMESEDFVAEDFERKYLAGFMVNYRLKSIDSGVAPQRGIELNVNSNYQKYLSTEDYVFSVGSDLRFFLPLLVTPQVVVGSKTGYSKVFGSPQIYHYPSLGQNNQLRGYRNERFRGEAIFFQQFDLRMHLFHWDNNVLPFSFGVVGGYDIARVFDDESSDDYHTSRTVGASINILDMIMLHPAMSFSDDGDYFTFRLGYGF